MNGSGYTQLKPPKDGWQTAYRRDTQPDLAGFVVHSPVIMLFNK